MRTKFNYLNCFFRYLPLFTLLYISDDLHNFNYVYILCSSYLYRICWSSFQSALGLYSIIIGQIEFFLNVTSWIWWKTIWFLLHLFNCLSHLFPKIFRKVIILKVYWKRRFQRLRYLCLMILVRCTSCTYTFTYLIISGYPVFTVDEIMVH